MKNTYQDKSFVIVTHVYATGPAFFLEKFLVTRKSKRVLFIGLPFSYTKDKSLFYRYYETGLLKKEKKISRKKLPLWLFCLHDIVCTLYLVFKNGHFDYYIGADNLNLTSGLILRFSKKIDCAIFYSIDFIPTRFKNTILNSIYHLVEKIAVAQSNYVWNLSYQMVLEREKRGYQKSWRKKQMTVPIGTKPIKKLPVLKEENRKTIAFMGHLRKGQGVDLLLSSFQLVLEKIPDLKLRIIGGGELEEKLKKMASKLEIRKSVKFTGFLTDFSEVNKWLSKSALAIAPYADTPDNFTRYTDPGKVKDYLAQGLPVIVTKIPRVAFEIEQKKAGIAITYNKRELAEAMFKLLSNEKLLLKYRGNALKMAGDYTWDKIFERSFTKIFKPC